nr:flagellar export chaperone FliS [uncultured Anaerosporobacter sp.]
MAFNYAAAYQNNKIKTANKAELTLMLYDGAIKFCNKAKVAMEEGNIQETNSNIIKAENVIVELRTSLNKKYPVSEDFERVYDYVYRRLIEANIHKDKDVLEDAIRIIREMRETWVEVMKLAKNV